MKHQLPLIHVVTAQPVQGVPFPDENFDPAGLGDPQELRDRLDAQRVARTVLPFIDTRASHWRYYLFAAPPPSRGRPINISPRLLQVLEQTPQSRAGIGRRDYRRFEWDARRSKERFVERLERSFRTAYGSATTAFWRLDDTESEPADLPSIVLRKAARNYVLAEEYSTFFTPTQSPNRLRHLFRTRLVGLRRSLADHIVGSKYDLAIAARKAAAARELDESDRLLFFSWAVLQAYFGIADDGTVDDPEDEGSENDVEPNVDDKYFRALAQASLDLLDRLRTPGGVTQKQVNLIRIGLKTALTHKGQYRPPVMVWKLKNDGRRRRVFASLRLFAYTRLLRATAGDL